MRGRQVVAIHVVDQLGGVEIGIVGGRDRREAERAEEFLVGQLPAWIVDRRERRAVRRREAALRGNPRQVGGGEEDLLAAELQQPAAERPRLVRLDHQSGDAAQNAHQRAPDGRGASTGRGCGLGRPAFNRRGDCGGFSQSQRPGCSGSIGSPAFLAFTAWRT